MKINFIPILITIFFILGCEKEVPEDLGDGYTFFTTNPSNHYINKNRKAIVHTNIIEYKVIGKFIVGFREPTKFHEVPESLISKNYGYFVLDKKTGNLREGLSKSEFEEFLQQIDD